MKERRITAFRVLLGVVLLVALAYAGGMVWLVTQETRLVFRAGVAMGALRPAQPYEQHDHTPDDGSPQPDGRVWLMPTATDSDDHPWVIFLHGNGSTLASRLNILHYERLRALGLNIAAPEYRGYGGLAGVPSEEGLAEDARRAYDDLRREKKLSPRQIIIYGWSLGSAVAVNLASHADEAAVILEGAPASIVAIGQQRYPYFPVRLLIRNPFDSISRIDKIGSPVLFLHSPEDEVVPFAEGKRLFDAAATPKEFVEVTGGHVNAAEKDPQFFIAVRDFLRAQHLLP